MTKTYVVSGCGMKFDAALWPVPANVEIHFYFQCMRVPQFYKTRTILDKMMLDVGMFPDRVAGPGETPTSGVFRRQTGHLAMDLSGSDAQRPVALSHVVKVMTADRQRSPTAIHWIVRDEEAPVDLSHLDCLYPPRLRNGGVEDGEESHHVPLVDVFPPPPLAEAGFGPTQEWPGVRRRANTR